jgi:aryl-alcohol dehydrogenase-like predicted oxidoreductase
VKAERLQLLAWSAQARGWFVLPAGPLAAAPDGLAVFDTAANREARVRCRALAAAHGVAPVTVALAWTHAQDDLYVHPIIGPEGPMELAESLASEQLELTAGEVAWLSAARDFQDTLGSAAGTP